MYPQLKRIAQQTYSLLYDVLCEDIVGIILEFIGETQIIADYIHSVEYTIEQTTHQPYPISNKIHCALYFSENRDDLLNFLQK